MSELGITGVLLCGGAGQRFGGVDKPLARLAGRPLAAHALDRLVGQVEEVLVSANRNRTEYARLGHPVIPDRISGRGPLGGVEAAAARAGADLLLVCPGDAPGVPRDLATRLAAALETGVDAAIPHDGERAQVLFLLVRREAALTARDYLDRGGRSVHGWLDGLRVVEVPVPDPAAFFSVNTPEDLDRLARRGLP